MPELLCYNCFCEHNPYSGPCPKCGYDHASYSSNYPLSLPGGSILNGQYIVGRVLGQGGFGITYLALDHHLRIKVAIKEYLPETMATRIPGNTTVNVYSNQRRDDFDYGAECFLEEAKVLAKFIGCKNIAGVRSYFTENGTAYFVMDYIEGISFKTYIKNHGGKVSYTDALKVLMPVMDALEVVHAAGYTHRDVTPDNIYITGSGEIKLLDFGSARFSVGDKSKSLDVILKQGYAPKEQYMRRSRQGPYTDIYSLGACFYAAITGYLPPESLERMERDELISFSARGIRIPAALDNAIEKALEVRSEDRFQSIPDFKAALLRDPQIASVVSGIYVQSAGVPVQAPVPAVSPSVSGAPVVNLPVTRDGRAVSASPSSNGSVIVNEPITRDGRHLSELIAPERNVSVPVTAPCTTGAPVEYVEPPAQNTAGSAAQPGEQSAGAHLKEAVRLIGGNIKKVTVETAGVVKQKTVAAVNAIKVPAPDTASVQNANTSGNYPVRPLQTTPPVTAPASTAKPAEPTAAQSDAGTPVSAAPASPSHEAFTPAKPIAPNRTGFVSAKPGVPITAPITTGAPVKGESPLDI